MKKQWDEIRKGCGVYMGSDLKDFEKDRITGYKCGWNRNICPTCRVKTQTIKEAVEDFLEFLEKKGELIYGECPRCDVQDSINKNKIADLKQILKEMGDEDRE